MTWGFYMIVKPEIYQPLGGQAIKITFVGRKILGDSNPQGSWSCTIAAQIAVIYLTKTPDNWCRVMYGGVGLTLHPFF